MRRIVFSLLLVLATALFTQAQDFKEVRAKIELADGDTFVFLGDSITHHSKSVDQQCLYTQYIEDYYYTRYPKLHIRFHNAGVGGDTAGDALVRFDEDVASFKPKYVAILLGMNDGRYRCFDHDIFRTYETDMTTLLVRIAAIGSVAIPMGPTMFDARAALLRWKTSSPDVPRIRPCIEYYDAVLAFFGTWLQQQAVDRGLGYVDMFTPLHRITRIERESDPKFSMIPDAVHPDPGGHAVMAVAFLDDTHAAREVSRIHAVRRDTKWVVKSSGGEARNIVGTNQRLRFSFQADSLPWVLPEEAQLGFRLAHGGRLLSKEQVRVFGLAPGRYDLKIDDQVVGTYSDAQLAHGVALQDNAKTPQYQQAMRVALLNKERNEKAVHPLRNEWRSLKLQRLKLQRWRNAHPDDRQGALQRQAAFTAWKKSFSRRVASLLKAVLRYNGQIYAANQPPMRQYSLRKVE